MFKYVSCGSSRSSAWSVTFTDLLSLIMTFFILLYATSSIENSAWDDIADSVTLENGDGSVPTINTEKAEYGDDIDYLLAVMKGKLRGIDIDYLIHKEDRDIVISFAKKDLFLDAGGVLNEKASFVINLISDIMVPLDNKMEVVNYCTSDVYGICDLQQWEFAFTQSINLVTALSDFEIGNTVDVSNRFSNNGDIISIVIMDVVPKDDV